MEATRAEPQDHKCRTADADVVNFDGVLLHKKLLNGIYSHQFEKLNSLQKQAIVSMIKGGDIVVQAPPGSGKTSAFSIGLLQRCEFRHRQLQGLVLSSTRELAQQTHSVISSIGNELAEGQPFCATFIGGTRVHDDLKKLNAGVIIAVGTPGRVTDVIARGALRTEMLKVLVLDDAEELMPSQSCSEIYAIFQNLPRDIQVALFSASMRNEVLELAKKIMRNPTRILEPESLKLDCVKQFYVNVEEDHKLETLRDLYESVSIAQSVIFANTRRKVDYIKDNLIKKGLTVSHMHGEMQLNERADVMATFRRGSSLVLVTTDPAARLIDASVNIVINYDLPLTKENYLRRIGRGVRYGRKVVFNFVSQRDVELLRELEAHYHTQIEDLPLDFAKYLLCE